MRSLAPWRNPRLKIIIPTPRNSAEPSTILGRSRPQGLRIVPVNQVAAPARAWIKSDHTIGHSQWPCQTELNCSIVEYFSLGPLSCAATSPKLGGLRPCTRKTGCGDFQSRGGPGRSHSHGKGHVKKQAKIIFCWCPLEDYSCPWLVLKTTWLVLKKLCGRQK